MSNVKGSSLASRFLWVSLSRGEAGMKQLAAAATPELRAVIERGASLSKWYPFAQFIELSELMDGQFGSGDGALHRVLGRHSAEAHLTTIYRLFYKVGTVHWILGRAARLWGAYYDSGNLELYTRRARTLEMRLMGFATPHKIHCATIAGWVERSVELSGGHSVQVHETACRVDGAPHCEFRCSWE